MYSLIQQTPTFVAALNCLQRIDRLLHSTESKLETPFSMRTKSVETPFSSALITEKDPLFSLKDVALGWKGQDGIEVLRDVTVEVKRGDFCLIIGP